MGRAAAPRGDNRPSEAGRNGRGGTWRLPRSAPSDEERATGYRGWVPLRGGQRDRGDRELAQGGLPADLSRAQVVGTALGVSVSCGYPGRSRATWLIRH